MSQLNILILEDNLERFKLMRQRLDELNVPMHLLLAQTVPEFIKAIKTASWDLISLDHDLGGQEFVESGPGTGYEAATWLSNNLDTIPENTKVWIHSLNPEGRRNMLGVLDFAEEKPFWWGSKLRLEPL